MKNDITPPNPGVLTGALPPDNTATLLTAEEWDLATIFCTFYSCHIENIEVCLKIMYIELIAQNAITKFSVLQTTNVMSNKHVAAMISNTSTLPSLISKLKV